MINHWFLPLNCFVTLYSEHCMQGAVLAICLAFWRLLLPKTIQYGHHKMDNHPLIHLPLLLSAYLHQGESGYVPGNLAVHEQPFRCDTASFLIFAHILQVIKHNTVDGVQNFKFAYSSTPQVWKWILWISWYSRISGI